MSCARTVLMHDTVRMLFRSEEGKGYSGVPLQKIEERQWLHIYLFRMYDAASTTAAVTMVLSSLFSSFSDLDISRIQYCREIAPQSTIRWSSYKCKSHIYMYVWSREWENGRGTNILRLIKCLWYFILKISSFLYMFLSWIQKCKPMHQSIIKPIKKPDSLCSFEYQLPSGLSGLIDWARL